MNGVYSNGNGRESQEKRACGKRKPLAPLPGADSPYQGEMSRRDKGGRDAISRRLTERLYQICVEKPKPQIQFAVWKGRNGLRGKEAPRTAGLVPPRPVLTRLRRPHLFSRKRKDGGEKSAWMRLVHPASEFRRAPSFWMSFHSVVTLRVFTTRRLIRGFQICN